MDINSKSVPSAEGNLKAFAASLKTSLKQNRQLQKQILAALESLSRQKENNRRKASQLTRELYLETEGIERQQDGSAKPPAMETYKEANVKDVKTLLQKVIKGQDKDDDSGSGDDVDASMMKAQNTDLPERNADPSGEQTEAPGNSDSSLKADESSQTLTVVQARAKRQLKRNNRDLLKAWSSDIYRFPVEPLDTPFFIDPVGSTPHPNPDTLKRRNIEAQRQDKLHLAHLFPDWNGVESKCLEQLVMEAIAKQQEQEQTQQPAINFELIAKKLEEKRKPDAKLPRKQPRSAQECQIQYQRIQCEKQPKMTKTEVTTVVQEVQRLIQEAMSQNQNINEEDAIINVDWTAVAKVVGNDRSPWRCFATYQKTKPPVSTLGFTPQQDELLLTYVAAMGPQFVVDRATTNEMCRKLFPEKLASQIATRLAVSLVNVKLRQASWSIDEERKLVLAHKIYREDKTRVQNQFFRRSSRSTREKWNRTLDPSFTKSRPFSKQEDELLKRVLQEKLQNATADSSGLNWFEMARQNFPDRRPEQLQQRWAYELASNDDLLRKTKVDLLAKQKAAHGEKTQADFVLKVAKKPSKKGSKRKR